jgi:hypothetical protein
MPDFLYQIAIRLAVMIPAIMITAALLWYAAKKFGRMRVGGPIDPRDMRTWSLQFALADSALFALTFAIVIVAMGESEWSAAIAGGASAIIAIGLGPRLLGPYMR